MPKTITPAKRAEMNAEIVCRLISIGGETADYAAARIEELEEEVKQLKDALDAEKGGE